MAKRAKLQTSRRIPVREEKRPSGFDLPKAQPVVTPVKRQEPVRSVPIKQAPAPTITRPIANDPISTGLMRPLVSTAPVAKSPVKAIAPSLAGPVKKETPEEAIVGLGDFFSQQQGQSRALADMAAESGDYSGLDKSVDISRITQNPLGALDDYFEEKVDDNLVEYVEENEIPTFIEKEDGTKVFLNTGTQTSIARVAGEEHQGSGGRYEASGPVGTYSAEWIESPSTVAGILNTPPMQILGALNPVANAVMTGVKVAAGEDVSPLEIATAALTGLEVAGAITPPSSGALPTGQAGPALPTTGNGLFGTTYAQTQAVVKAAAAGNAEGAALALVGQPLINSSLASVGLTEDVITGAGIQYDDFQAGIGKAVTELAGGADLDDALLSGLGKYIIEGGSLGVDLPDTPNIDLGIVEDVIRAVVRPIGAAGTAIADFVENAVGQIKVPEELKAAGRQVEDIVRTVGSTTEDVARTVGSATEDVVRPVGSAVDDVIIQPARTILKEADDTFVQPAGEALSALDTAIREVVPGIEDFVRDAVNPLDNFVDDIEFPDIGLPDISLGLPDLGGVLGGLALMPQPATATTNKIFDNELFKFKTEIGITDRDALIDIEDFLTSPFESSFAQTGRF
jgi:hypothetical protein